MKARIAVLLFSMLLFERSHSQEVIASSGNFDSMASGSLSWTLGEIATETVTDGNSFLTQGFQQPFEGGVGIIEQSGNPYIHFFPNPFHSSITILNQGFEGNCQLKIIENSGKIVHFENIAFISSEKAYPVPLLTLAPGFYQLQLLHGTEQVMNCRIVKY